MDKVDDSRERMCVNHCFFCGEDMEGCILVDIGLVPDYEQCHLAPPDMAAIKSAIAGKGTLFCMASWHKEFQIDETQARIAGRAVGLPLEFYQEWRDQGGE